MYSASHIMPPTPNVTALTTIYTTTQNIFPFLLAGHPSHIQRFTQLQMNPITIGTGIPPPPELLLLLLLD
jgi:hypothetical protein